MHSKSYRAILDDDPVSGRLRERGAFDHAIVLLTKAEANGADSLQAAEAIYFVEQLWLLLLEDLAGSANELPDRLKAGLISIGIWMTKEIRNIRMGDQKSFAGLIEVNGLIRDGLR